MERISYFEPLDVAKVFRNNAVLSYSMQKIFDEFSAIVIGSKEDKIIPPIVFNPSRKVFNIDYNFIVHSLSKIVDNEEKFLNDFKLQSQLSNAKNQQLLTYFLLEGYLGIVSNNAQDRNKLNFRHAHRPILYSGFGKSIFAQMAAVTFLKTVEDFVSPASIELAQSISLSRFIEQEAFGQSEVKNFWLKKNDTPQYVFSIG